MLLQACRCSPPIPHNQDTTQPRIASLSPALTEVAFDLELGSHVVGVSRFDTHPPDVTQLPKLGGQLDPNLEALVALRPTLILTSPSIKGIEPVAKQLGATLVSIEVNDLEGLQEAYRRVANAADIKAKGRERLDTLMETLQQHTRPRPDTPLRVLLVVGRTPGKIDGLYTAGPGSFVDALLQRAGAINALPAGDNPWPPIGKEALFEHDPDVILELSGQTLSAEESTQTREVWQTELPQLRAVKQGRVFVLGGSHLLVPGPRVTHTLKDLRRVLDPLQ